MPELTRRRSLDAPDECWHVWYGDVRVGTIAIRTGMPPGEDPWGWACGFYPSHRVKYRLEKRASAGRWSHFCEAIACAQGEHRRSG